MAAKPIMGIRKAKCKASRTWREGGPDEKMPNRSGIRSILDWMRYPVEAMA